jgi:hypothetical protein
LDIIDYGSTAEDVMTNLRTKLRSRRHAREFDRAMRVASPTVRAELAEAASRALYERL